MGKTKRLIELMEVVKLKREFTVQELADEFHVSYRTMLRDLQEISTLGIPLYSEQGNNGGYRILDFKENTKKTEIIRKKKSTYLGYFFTAPYTSKQETEILAPRLWIQLLKNVSELSLDNQPLTKVALSQFRKHDFTYFVTVEIENFTYIPKGMTALSIPDREYAKSTHKSTLDLDKVIHTYEDIIRWATSKGYTYEESALHLEIFDERFQPRAPQTNFDIYIPIKNIANSVSNRLK